jgi:threonine aldolase
MQYIDFRSDTVTLPTQTMMDAINSAILGDDVYVEDNSTLELEKLSASITGKESALLVSSGTMGNLICNLVHCSRGTEVIMGDKSHTFIYESGGISSYGGIHSHQLKNNVDGTIDINDIKEAIRIDDVHFPRTSLVCIENTHNKCHGFPLELDYINLVCNTAHENNIKVHMDGARLFNACAALALKADTILENIDSVTFCLSKGLSAPIGSMICGSSEFIAEARRIRKSLGGGMRQTGIIAAPGIISLNSMIDRLKEDHLNAKHLADSLSKLEGIELNPDFVKTNIIFFNFNHSSISSSELVSHMKLNGIIFSNYKGKHCRLVTHNNISRDDIENVIDVFNKLLS